MDSLDNGIEHDNSLKDVRCTKFALFFSLFLSLAKRYAVLSPNFLDDKPDIICTFRNHLLVNQPCCWNCMTKFNETTLQLALAFTSHHMLVVGPLKSLGNSWLCPF